MKKLKKYVTTVANFFELKPRTLVYLIIGSTAFGFTLVMLFDLYSMKSSIDDLKIQNVRLEKRLSSIEKDWKYYLDLQDPGFTGQSSTVVK